MADLLWRLLRGFGGDEKDGAWLRKHPNAHVEEWDCLEHGRKITMRDGNDKRTYVTDDIGNIVQVER